MNTYRVYFRSDLQWGREDIEAETPARALELARQRAQDITRLDLDYYEPFDNPINAALFPAKDGAGRHVLVWDRKKPDAE